MGTKANKLGSIGTGPQMLSCLSQKVVIGDFTDGAGTSGYVDLAKQLPQGAIVLGFMYKVVVGFGGDTSAALQVGDTSDLDRYTGSTDPSVLTTGDIIGSVSTANDTTGVKSQNPTAHTVRLTITGAADFTSIVTAGAGELDIYIWFIEGVPSSAR